MTSSLTALREAEKSLEPFATFIDGADFIPDDSPISQGSPMARRQVIARDFRRARSALAIVRAAIEEESRRETNAREAGQGQLFSERKP